VSAAGGDRNEGSWRLAQGAVLVLVAGFFLYSLRDLLNPFLLYWVVIALLVPFRGVRGHALVVTVATLLAEGFAEAGNLAVFRFFVNDFSTRTQGLDLVATWTPPAIGGRTTFSGIFNFTDTEVTAFNPENIDADRIAALTLGLPRIRWNFGATHTTSHWTLMARMHYYGSYWDREDARSAMGVANSHLYPLYAGKPLVDVELGIPIKNVTLSVGAQNVFNTYPDENPGALAGVGNRYGQFGPFGFNGGYYYVRVGYTWGNNF